MAHAPDIVRLKSEDVESVLREMATRYVPEIDLSRTRGPEAALLHVFSHLVEETVQRLARVPERCCLAFLEMLGIQLRPAQPARVPVTFVPAEGLATGAFVPERTRVAAPESDTRSMQVFETERGFVASRTTLSEVIGVLPETDTVYHHTQNLRANREFVAWQGEDKQEHVLLLGHESLLALDGAATIQISLSMTHGYPADLVPPHAVWEYLGKDGKTRVFLDAKCGPKDPGVIELNKREGEIGKVKFEGRESRWIRCKLKRTSGGPPLLGFDSIRIADVLAEAVSPDGAYYNSIPLDLSSDAGFSPFGNRPRIYDTFHLACREVFSKRGAKVTLKFEMGKEGGSDAELTWEYWNGSGWRVLPGLDINFHNTWDDKFACPQDIAEIEVNGETNFWIRARIIDGDYGKEVFKPVGGAPVTAWEVDTSEFAPPRAKSVTLAYSLSDAGTVSPVSPEHCLAVNHGEVQDLTVDNRDGSREIRPFRSIPERGPSLFLGFSDPFREGNASAFISLREQDGTRAMTEIEWTYWERTHDLAAQVGFTDSVRDRIQLVSNVGISPGTVLLIEEVLEAGTVTDVVRVKDVGSDGLVILEESPTATFTQSAVVCRRASLEIADRTDSLTLSGPLEFLAPGSICRTHRSGRDAFWIMGTVVARPVDWQPPRIRGIHPNTVWAEQCETIRDEILGSGDGGGTREYSFLRKPVQRQDIWVMHGQTVPEEELANLGNDDLYEVRDEAGRILETWIRWKEVKDLLRSGPKDRRYVLDRAMGAVSFGDGIQGRALPIGRDNIRTDYQTGGGVQGNVGKGEISQIKTSVAGIDRAVNLEPAEGGADTELVSEVPERGPRLLRHRDRAVTVEDYERIARATSSDIARTKCFTEGDRVVVIVIPKGHERRPLPSQGLKRIVRERLQLLNSPALRPGALKVTGPDYVEICVIAEIIPTSVDRALTVRREAIQHLSEYLHPLTGGNEGTGWTFGRDIRISDVYALLESLPGVDHVVASLKTEGVPEGREMRTSEIVCSGEHKISVRLGG